MNLLVAYDGSQFSEAALDDLNRAGLPSTGEAHVLTVAEVWLPPPNLPAEDNGTSEYIKEAVKKHREKGERMLNEAAMMAKHAAGRVRTILPNWKITSGATYGSPAWEIIAKADELKPDLIVVGSHGQTALSRFVLGSISQKVLNDAECSVRVARGRIEVEPGPGRILIGYDGSAGADAAVEAVVDREWPDNTDVQVLAATDSIVPTGIGRFIPPVADWAKEVQESDSRWITALADKAVEKLKDAGLKVSRHVTEGNPKHVLVHEAENWHADCIFVGANAFGSRFEKFLLGSTSAAVAARANCSVEVIRRSST
jgi:nucleotide-binding universal stress UspA family protein